MNKEELVRRVKNAIILLSEGHFVNVGELTFSCQDGVHFSVLGSTHNNLLENVTKQSAIAELADIKSLFWRITEAVEELAQFIQEKEIEYFLYYDYGMGSVIICKESAGQLIWETQLSR